MKLSDESLLTAYLDGELGPVERSAVELALVSDSDLAERFRGMVSVHELIAGLPVPLLPVDLAGPVVAAIEQRSLRRRFWEVIHMPAPRRVAAALAGLGLAASLLVGLGLVLFARRSAQAPLAPHPQIAQALPSIPQVSPSADERSGKTRRALANAMTPLPASRTRDEGVTANRDDHAQAIRAMLDNPGLRRIFYVTDVIGGELDTRERVEDLVKDTPRTDAAYGRITVSQGIVIDPRHPNEAAVFVLVMNDQELRRFQKRLELAFPQQVEETGVEPAVVTQLADIGQITVLPGTPASEVIIPRDTTPQVAIKTPRGPQRTFQSTQIDKDFGLPDLPPAPTRENVVTAAPQPATRGADPVQAEHALDDAIPRAPNLHDPPSIVLVWVTTR
jgi:hypothetical protein